MSHNSLTLPTTGTVSGLQMTQDTNNAIDTLNTLASGASAPGSPEAGQWWHDTTNNILKLRSLDNTTWIPALYLNESVYLAGPPSLGQINPALNRMLNGAMVVDQVNEGASYSIPVNNTFTYTLDQHQVVCLSGSAAGVTAQRVSDAPAGFANSLKITVGTGAGSVAAGDYLSYFQPIEGGNISDLNYGTAGATATSLSFWVKSSVTGNFAATLSSATGGNRNLVHRFNIPSAGVWQLVTIPNIVGDQSGTWPTGAVASLNLGITIASGSTYQTSTLDSWLGGYFLASNTQSNGVLTTSGATFQITGVMWNAGSFCQPFEKLLPQDEIFRLQRYYEKSYDAATAPGTASVQVGSIGQYATSASFFATGQLTPKRADPTMTYYSSNSGTSGKMWDLTANADVSVSGALAGHKAFSVQNSATTTSGHLYLFQWTANARM